MEFYREGFLQKAGKGIQKHVHSWRPRYFVLDGQTLKYYKCKEVLAENLLGCIHVAEIESVNVMKNDKRSFQITTKVKRTYYMAAKSEEEMQGWIKCLEMAKEKQLDRGKKNSAEKPVPSLYDEVNLSPPSKPPRSLTGSGAANANSPQSPKSPTLYATPGSPTSSTSGRIEPVLSAYHCIAFPTTDNKANESPQPSKDQADNNLYADPTYDTINEKENGEKSDPTADLYDTVSNTSTSPSKKMSRASDPLPHTTAPPPLPARLPSMSGEVDEIMPEDEQTEKNKSEVDAMSSPFGLYEGFGNPEIGNSELDPNVKKKMERKTPQPNGNALYDEIGNLDTANSMKSLSKNAKPQPTNDGIYDEVGAVNAVTNSESKENEPKEKGFELYDEVITQDSDTQAKQNEEHNKPLTPQPDPTHVYAKPDKKSSSMRRERSKRKLMPGLMDVGEVDIDIEEEAAGGKETLKRGMTKPQGERFAIEELKEVLAEFDREENNNQENAEVLSDFDVNQSESAFEVLKLFLQRYE